MGRRLWIGDLQILNSIIIEFHKSFGTGKWAITNLVTQSAERSFEN